MCFPVSTGVYQILDARPWQVPREEGREANGLATTDGSKNILHSLSVIRGWDRCKGRVLSSAYRCIDGTTATGDVHAEFVIWISKRVPLLASYFHIQVFD